MILPLFFISCLEFQVYAADVVGIGCVFFLFKRTNIDSLLEMTNEIDWDVGIFGCVCDVIWSDWWECNTSSMAPTMDDGSMQLKGETRFADLSTWENLWRFLEAAECLN